MTNLHSQYISGLQLVAGLVAGSSMGTSGINPIIDRLNSISNNNNLIIGSMVSGTSTNIYGKLFSTISIGSIITPGITVPTGGQGGGTGNIGKIILSGSSNCLLIHTGSFVYTSAPHFFYNIKFGGVVANATYYTCPVNNGSGAFPFTTISTFYLPSGETSRQIEYLIGTYNSVGNSKDNSLLCIIPLNLNVRVNTFT